MSSPSLVGTFDRMLDSTKFLTQRDLSFLDYRYLGGIFEEFPGVFVRDQNSVGGHNQVNIRGADWRSIAVASNGRLLNDPASGIYNLYHFTTEYADRIEFVSGPRAFLYGVNSSGGAINLVTKNYNSNRPFSKLNYYETTYKYQYSDGTFSQNISRKVNFTFGFQHQGTDGRFINSAHEAWNMRVKLRYNLSQDFNIILSEYLTNTQTQMNGGVNFAVTGNTSLAFDQILATVVNPDVFEKTTRHDVDLSFVGTLLGDTTNVSMLTFYYSNNFREYRDKENVSNLSDVKIDSDHRSSWMGAHFTQNVHTAWQRFDLGASIELRQIEGSPNLGRQRNSLGSIWAKEELLFIDDLTLAGYARYDNFLRQSGVGVGTDATLHLPSGISLFGGLSTSKRFPNYVEMFWTDSTVNRTRPIEPEIHRTVEIGGRWRTEDLTMQIAYFHRTIEDPILVSPGGTGYVFPGLEFSNGARLTTNGIEVKLLARIWKFHADGVALIITQQDQAGNSLSTYPKFTASGGIYYWQKLLNDALDLKIGLKGKYISGSRGEVFNPEVLAYVPNTGASIGFGSSVDGFVIAGLGNAYIHLMWENFINTRYFTTPYYPVLDRAIKFGVSWQFLD